MFETDPNIGLQGIAFRNKLAAESSHESYLAWKAYAKRLEVSNQELVAEVERLKLEVHAQKTNSDKLAKELKRISEIAAEVPQLASALRAQRAISEKLRDKL